MIAVVLRQATTFEELYNSLCDLKINLESNPVIERVDVTMDVRTVFPRVVDP